VICRKRDKTELERKLEKASSDDGASTFGVQPRQKKKASEGARCAILINAIVVNSGGRASTGLSKKKLSV